MLKTVCDMLKTVYDMRRVYDMFSVMAIPCDIFNKANKNLFHVQCHDDSVWHVKTVYDMFSNLNDSVWHVKTVYAMFSNLNDSVWYVKTVYGMFSNLNDSVRHVQ